LIKKDYWRIVLMGKIISLLVSILLLTGVFLFLSSDMLESEPPVIEAPDTVYWNLRDELPLKIKDNTGIANYKIFFSGGSEEVLIESVSPSLRGKELDVKIAPPMADLFLKTTNFKVKVVVNDISKWNLLEGNVAQKEINIIADRNKPKLFLLSKSYGIFKGGSVAAVFSAEDENLKELYVEAGDKVFKPFRFQKDGYYAVIIPWSVKDSEFVPKIIALDGAGNKSVMGLEFYNKKIEYRHDKIELKDPFLDGKIADLSVEVGRNPDPDKVARFKFINEEIRNKNEKELYDVARKNLNENDSFTITPFYPLRNGQKVGDFGDYRTFLREGQPVSNSYHLGIDLASTQHASIKASNSGTVIYADFNGIYGNTIMLDHGLGVVSLYSHCSEFRKMVGDVVNVGEEIALTGMTGLALGDHLHFGMLVQGIEVRPQEWMDSDWINKNITVVFNEAKNMIQNKRVN